MQPLQQPQSWETVYQQNKTVWGEKPDWLLLDYAEQIPVGQVLDLGMGEGRNALFFAQRGFPVRGVDLSPAAVQHCQERAQALGVSIQTEVNDILKAEIEPDSLTLVISTMCLQFLKRSEAHEMMRRIRQGVKPGGMVYLTMFSTDEPGYASLKQTSEEIEPDTFYIPARETYVHYFTQSEVLNAFPDFRLLSISQSRFLDPGHPGVEQPHYHSIITYLGQKH